MLQLMHAILTDEHQDKISSLKKSKKVSFNLYKVLLVIYKVLWLESLSLVKVPIVSYQFS